MGLSMRTGLLLSAAALLLFLAGCLAQPAGSTVLSGNIYWEGEVRVQGEVVIGKDAVLTIAPGSRILFMPYLEENPDRQRKPHELRGSKLLVHGKIIARGTANEPIVFSHVDPDAPPGSWGGIKVQDAEQAYFYNCAFRQAMNALHSCRSWIAVEYCRFEHNQVGLLFHNAEMLIERNLLRHNGTAIFYLSGAPVICENRIVDNDNGLVIADASGAYRIENNSFFDNRSYNVGLGERVRHSVDLRNNYWGTSDSKTLEGKLFDGRSSLWKGEINYRPLRSAPVPISGLE